MKLGLSIINTNLHRPGSADHWLQRQRTFHYPCWKHFSGFKRAGIRKTRAWHGYEDETFWSFWFFRHCGLLQDSVRNICHLSHNPDPSFSLISQPTQLKSNRCTSWSGCKPAAETWEETPDMYVDMYLGQVNHFTASGIRCLSSQQAETHMFVAALMG